MIRRLFEPIVYVCALVALAAVVAADPAPAHAGKVVVLTVQGDEEGELQDGLIAVIEEHHELMSAGEFERAARRSGLDDLDGPAIGKIARKLDLDAVIQGTVSPEDEGYMFTVRIRSKTGRTVKKISMDLARPRLSKKAKKRLGTGVLDGIDKVLGISDEDRGADEDDAEDRAVKSRNKARKSARELAADDDEDMEEEEEAPRKRSKKAKAKKAKPVKVAKATRRDDDGDGDDEEMDDAGEADGEGDDGEADGEGDAEDDEEDGDRVAARDDDDLEDALGVRDDADGDDDRPRAPRAWTRPAIRLDVGGSGKLRQLAFTSRPYEQAPFGYQSAMVPGARLEVEAYPLALAGDGAASGLGVAVEYDKTMLLTTRSSEAPDVALKTTQSHWSVGARYRYAFGSSVKAPAVTVGVGYGRRLFKVRRGDLPDGARLDMPDVDYKFIDPGLTFSLPISSKIALHAGGKALLVQEAGPIQAESSYGGAKITGVDGSFGLDVAVMKNVVVGLSGSFTQIGYEFVGNGEETFNRDLDPDTQDVGGASDRYIGVAGTVGVVY